MRHKILASTIILSLLAFMTVVAIRAGGQTGGTPDNPQVSTTQAQQADQLQLMERQLEQDRAAVHSAIAEHGLESAETQAARAKLMQDRDAYRALRQSMAPGRGARAGFGKGGGMGRMGGGGQRAGGGRCMRLCPFAPR